ncbi:MAG: aspartate ammonia-lyase, partial [Odoribacter sp.]|nr:aspartate ammonia-lyase [Odoribacter sp.]
MKTRIEHDLLGEKEVPADAYYGIQTLRGIENFQNISGITISDYPNYVKGLAMVKWAAAKANQELGILPDDIADAITKACEEIINGNLHDQFPVDLIQGGAGTSTNMNINEVVANRALELLGHQKGEYQYCHPNNHVNLSQSTNDAYPTAFKLAFIFMNEELVADLKLLIQAFRAKGEEFK